MEMDTRALLVDEGGIYVRPSSVSNGQTICDFCTWKVRGCLLERQKERCGQFVPALSFVSDEGLDGRFSTWRGSRIWYDRIRVVARTHKTVSLITTSGDFIGQARVVDAVRSTFEHLMTEYAHTNHLMKHRGLSKEQSAQELKRWIKNNMGSRFVKRPEAIGTVILLERIEDGRHQEDQRA